MYELVLPNTGEENFFLESRKLFKSNNISFRVTTIFVPGPGCSNLRLVRNLNADNYESLNSKFSLTVFAYLMIVCSRNNRENYRENYLGKMLLTKVTRVKSNPRLRANRPSNNWDLSSPGISNRGFPISASKRNGGILGSVSYNRIL